MIETALQICVAAVAVSMLLCTWRLWRGPTAPDRILSQGNPHRNGNAKRLNDLAKTIDAGFSRV